MNSSMDHTRAENTNFPEMKVVEYADILIKDFLKQNDHLKSGTIYTAKIMLLRFTRNVDPKFVDVTPHFINKYENFLKDIGLDVSMIEMLLKAFHNIYLYAIKNKIIPAGTDPFASSTLYDITMMN